MRWMATHEAAAGRPRRRGMASLLLVVVLALLTVLLSSALLRMAAGRRVLGQRQNKLQAIWLARAGLELASDRVLAGPKGYRGESLEIVPHSQVRTRVRAGDSPETFVITSDAEYPTNSSHPMVRSLTRQVRRVSEKGRVRLEVVAEPGPQAKAP